MSTTPEPIRAQQETVSTPAPGTAAGSAPASSGAGLRQSVRGMGYRDGAAALSPRGGGTGGAPRVTAQLRQVAGGGTGASTTAPAAAATRPMEVITASDATRTTRGGFTLRVMAMMRQQPGLRFVEAARRIAAGNLVPERPSRSGRLGEPDVLQDAPATRFALVLAASNYQGETDLPEIAGQTRPGGSLRTALEGDYGRGGVQVVGDPTASQMEAAIREAIATVSARLPHGQRGELMVNFQGHGDRAGMEGVEGGRLTPAQLAALSREAQAARVEMTVVSDACYQGTAAVVGEMETNQHLRGRIAAADLSAADAAALRGELEELRQWTRMVARVMPLVEDLDRHLLPGDARAGWTPTRERYLEARNWLRIYGALVRGPMRLLSREAAGQVRELWEAVVLGPEPPESPGAQATRFTRGMRDRFGRTLERVTEEIAQAQEGIDLAVHLADRSE